MGKRLKRFQAKLSIPSGRAILHVVIVEIIINLLWNWVSQMFTFPIIREIGFLVLIITGLWAVAWYLPKLSPKFSGASSESKPKVIHEYSSLDENKRKLANWMSANMEYEKRNPRHFIHARPDWFGLYLDSVSGAFILFRFAILTSTIHTLKFLPEKTSGHIKYMKQDLARVPEVEDQSHDILTRETQTMLAVKQFLEPVTEAHIRKLHGNQEVPEVSFELGELNIFMQATQPDGSIDKELWKLPLPGAWKVRLADKDIRS